MSGSIKDTVGVYWNGRQGRWRAYITIGEKRFYLGAFKNRSDALQARWEAEEKGVDF